MTLKPPVSPSSLKLKPHPMAAELFAPLEGQDYADLVADIGKHGLRQAIDICDGKIIDGNNRFRACIETGTEPRFHERRFRTDEALRDFILSANLIRRHLTAEQKRELAAKLIKLAPEKSDRAIAEQVKSNRNTVGAVRAELEKSGDVSRSDTRTDTRGRAQPAHKSKTNTKANGAAAPVPAADDGIPPFLRRAPSSAAIAPTPSADEVQAMQEHCTCIEELETKNRQLEQQNLGLRAEIKNLQVEIKGLQDEIVVLRKENAELHAKLVEPKATNGSAALTTHDIALPNPGPEESDRWIER